MVWPFKLGWTFLRWGSTCFWQRSSWGVFKSPLCHKWIHITDIVFYWSFIGFLRTIWNRRWAASAVSWDGIVLNSACPSRRQAALNLLLCSDNILGEMMMSWPHLNTAAGLIANEFLPTQDYCTIHNWWWWWWGLHQTTSELNITWPLF